MLKESRVLLLDNDTNARAMLADAFARYGYEPSDSSLDAPFDTVVVSVTDEEQDPTLIQHQLRRAGVQARTVVLHRRDESGIPDVRTGDLLAGPLVLIARSPRVPAKAVFECRFGRIHVDFFARTAYRDGAPIGLSLMETDLLRYLVANEGHVLSREELLSNVWQYRSGDTRTVDMHVAALRRKLEENSKSPKYILTLRGKGYLFQSSSM